MKIFMDGPSIKQMQACDADGYTCNPTLVRALGVIDYVAHAKAMLRQADKLPVSIQVLSGDQNTMFAQAATINKLAPNAWAKVPILDGLGRHNGDLILAMVRKGLRLNITAVHDIGHLMQLAFIFEQAKAAHKGMIVSVFAGRLAETGIDPIPTITTMREMLPEASFLWAATRSVGDVITAKNAGCDIITMSPAMIDKYHENLGRNVRIWTQETVSKFIADGEGYTL